MNNTDPPAKPAKSPKPVKPHSVGALRSGRYPSHFSPANATFLREVASKRRCSINDANNELLTRARHYPKDWTEIYEAIVGNRKAQDAIMVQLLECAAHQSRILELIGTGGGGPTPEEIARVTSSVPKAPSFPTPTAQAEVVAKTQGSPKAALEKQAIQTARDNTAVDEVLAELAPQTFAASVPPEPQPTPRSL